MGRMVRRRACLPGVDRKGGGERRYKEMDGLPGSHMYSSGVLWFWGDLWKWGSERECKNI